MCLYDSDYYNFGQSVRDTRDCEGFELEVPLIHGNEAQSISLSFTHIYTLSNWPTPEALRAPNIVITTGWPWKINRFISPLPTSPPLPLSAPLFMVVTPCTPPSSHSVHLHSSLPPAQRYFSNFPSVSPTEPRGGPGENGAVIKLIHSR